MWRSLWGAGSGPTTSTPHPPRTTTPTTDRPYSLFRFYSSQAAMHASLALRRTPMINFLGRNRWANRAFLAVAEPFYQG